MRDADELYRAVGGILEGMGVEQGAQAILAVPPHERGARPEDRERALALHLALEADHAERARELLQAALARDPEDALATLRLGEIAQSEEEREQLFRRALRLAPDWSFGRSRLAHYLVGMGRAHEALEFTSGHEQESYQLLTAHARALLRVGRYEQAAAAFAQACVQGDEPEPWIYYSRWIAEDAAGMHEQALATAERALELWPGDPDYYVQLAGSLRKLGRDQEALQRIDEGRQYGLGESDALELEYDIAWETSGYERALELAEGGLALEQDEPPSGQLGEWQGRKLKALLALERVDEARALVGALELDADGWGRAAWKAMEEDAWELCLEFAAQALEREPENFAALYTRAQALQDMDREQEAVAAYQLLREAHPSEHNAYEKLGLLLALEGQAEQALELADRAVALGAFCSQAWATRGYAHFVRGDAEAARADLQTAWNRASSKDRREASHYWWILAALNGQPEQAASLRAQAVEEAETGIDRRRIAQADQLLALRGV